MNTGHKVSLETFSDNFTERRNFKYAATVMTMFQVHLTAGDLQRIQQRLLQRPDTFPTSQPTLSKHQSKVLADSCYFKKTFTTVQIPVWTKHTVYYVAYLLYLSHSSIYTGWSKISGTRFIFLITSVNVHRF